MDYKIILGILSLVVEFASYFVYLRSIYLGETKPHAFTWFVWGVLNAVAFAAVLISGGGSGSWVFIGNAIPCFIIAGIGFYQKHVEYDLYDWLALAGAIIGIILWQQTKNPLYAVILVSLSDMTAIIPTIRKAYKEPYEENLLSWFFGLVYYPLGILALSSLTLTTWLYPVIIMVTDSVLLLIIILRRKKLT